MVPEFLPGNQGQPRDRDVQECAGRHNLRGLDPVDRRQALRQGLQRKRLIHTALSRDNGRSSGARMVA